ncbi:MAG: bifunctional metallophosphatase/5'-nucleotidase [Bradymonadaceae bacterium]
MPQRIFQILFLSAALLVGACSSGPQVVSDAPPETSEALSPIEVELIAFNDCHGHLQGPSGTVIVDGERVEAGGIAHLAAHIKAVRDAHPNTVVVAAGDLIGASPLISAIFHDEPTIKALGMAGLEISSVGNHEFDRGVDELLRMVEGGCHPKEGCREGYTYEGASFQYLAANVRYRETGETILPAYEIREFEGVKIAFIGLTLEATPDIVVPSAIVDVTFENEIETINALVPELQAQGIESIVVLIHEGGQPNKEIENINECPDLTGPIVTIAEGVDDAVDVIVSGHTHQPYICEFGGKLVTSSQSFGRIATKISLTIDRESRDIVGRSARQIVITHDIEPVAEIATLVAEYEELSASLATRPVGKIKADINRERNEAGESPLGAIIADAQLAATTAPDLGAAKIAFMNPGGIRDALLFESPTAPEPGVVTYAHLHTVQPFGNNLITMSLTGTQIHRLLEQQWEGQAHPRILQPSKGFTYKWNPENPDGRKVDPGSIKLDGEVLDANKKYRVTVNNFLANGGDAFTVLTEGTDLIGGVIDLDALITYVEAHSPLAPQKPSRIQLAR